MLLILRLPPSPQPRRKRRAHLRRRPRHIQPPIPHRQIPRRKLRPRRPHVLIRMRRRHPRRRHRVIIPRVHIRDLQLARTQMIPAVHRRRQVRELRRTRFFGAVDERRGGVVERIAVRLIIREAVVVDVVGPGDVDAGGVAAAARNGAHADEPSNQSSDDGDGGNAEKTEADVEGRAVLALGGGQNGRRRGGNVGGGGARGGRGRQ